VIEWVKYAEQYMEKTTLTTDIIFENFSNPSAYRSNHKDIKTVILEGIKKEDSEYFKITNLIKTSLTC
jgi:hypothetical protein